MVVVRKEETDKVTDGFYTLGVSRGRCDRAQTNAYRSRGSVEYIRAYLVYFLLFILTLAYHTSRLGNAVHDLALFVLTSQLSYEVET